MLRTGEESIFYGRWAIVLATFIVIAGVGAATAVSLGGTAQPPVDGQYTLDTHGHTTPVSRAQWLASLIGGYTAFGFAMLAIFICIPLLTLWKIRYPEDDPRADHGTTVALSVVCFMLMIVAAICVNHYLHQVKTAPVAPATAPDSN